MKGRTHRVGESVGPFRDVVFAYEGGMAVVYRARRGGSAPGGRTWALKFPIDDRPGPLDPVARLRKEGELGQRLRHKNLVGVESIGHHEGVPYLVMPWIEGCSLFALLDTARRRGGAVDRLDGEVIAHIAHELLSGLAHVHGLGIVHRDVSPENVLVEFDGRVRLIDFGIASVWDGVPLKTRAGKPGYVAPEQLDGKADARSDLYAVGAVLAELAGADVDVRPVQVPAALPERVRRFIACLLQGDPAHRFASCEDALEGLQGAVDGGAIQRGRLALRALLVGLAPPQVGAQALVADVARTQRRARIAAVAIGVTVAVLAVGAIAVAGSAGESAGEVLPPVDAGVDAPIDAAVTAASAAPCSDRFVCIQRCRREGDPAPRDPRACLRLAALSRFEAPIDVELARRVLGETCALHREPAACGEATMIATLLRDPALRQWSAALGPAALRSGCEGGGALACAILVLQQHEVDLPDTGRAALCAATPSPSTRTPRQCALELARAGCAGELGLTSAPRSPELCALAARAIEEEGGAPSREKESLAASCARDDAASCHYLGLLESRPDLLKDACAGGVARACSAVAARVPAARDDYARRACALGDCTDAAIPGRELVAACEQGVPTACARRFEAVPFGRSAYRAALEHAAGADRDDARRLAAVTSALGAPTVERLGGGLPACWYGAAAACRRVQGALAAAATPVPPDLADRIAWQTAMARFE